MKTYHAIKTLALGGIAMFSLASCSLSTTSHYQSHQK